MATFFSLNSFQSQMPLFFTNFTALLGSDMEDLMEEQHLEEDVKESSIKVKDLIVYWYAYYYMCCVYIYYEKNQLSGTTGWDDIKEEFDFDIMLDLFSCHGINLWNVFDIIGLPDFLIVNPGVIQNPISPTLVTGTIIVEYFVESATQQPGDTHTLAHLPIGDASNMMVVHNGSPLLTSQYTKVGQDIQITIQVYQGDAVAILYMY